MSSKVKAQIAIQTKMETIGHEQNCTKRSYNCYVPSGRYYEIVIIEST